MLQLSLIRQHLEDLTGYFMPVMIDMLESRIRLYQGTEMLIGEQVSLGVMEELETKLIKKTLSASKKFTLKLSRGESVLLYAMLMKFPIPSDHFWRLNLRNNIVEQLHKQLL